MGKIKKILVAPMDWVLYSLMDDRQRKALGSIFSPKLKELLIKVLSGRKNEQRQELKMIKYHLYNLGFVERGLTDLEKFIEKTKDPFIKRLAIWELILWHINKGTKEGAEQALLHAPKLEKEKDADQRRRIAIIKAECYEVLGQREDAKEAINGMLHVQTHPDLYLALANLENDIDERIQYINKVMEMYKLAPITIEPDQGGHYTYDGLKTHPLPRGVEESPKVSVILPAFKAEEGIGTAIDSILSQTWSNLELLVVDDCSPDNTVEVVKKYVEQDARVKLYSTPVNSGPYVARNIALKEATGEFVTINDADDWSHAEKLEKQVRHLLHNKQIIANTSEHSRLTEEELKLYRRGTPGKYIFPNMSSIMFRREQVLKKIGYWDSVRFAADGEFKRRIIRTFGKQAYVDLPTGPLSLPRQSVTSLTGSSAFGYNGFFMGVRREYVESLEAHHEQAASLYYEYPQDSRPFPVPVPMWPERKQDRSFDIVFATDLRINNEELQEEVTRLKQQNMKIGLVQLNSYDFALSKEVSLENRKLMDGEQVQMLVFGERIKAGKLIIFNHHVLQEQQQYVPEIETETIKILINTVPEVEEEKLDVIKSWEDRVMGYFGKTPTWYATSLAIKQVLADSLPEIEVYQPEDIRKERKGYEG
ncbi:glycosyltransferase family 2 protein [Oceanobacillus manasiensis]|uniref:glycosyltransferase family 2 protein n=1 Tax=Oceanobacillus manasiensis TaxID=586413 RepID=UPI0005A7B850|nr:glycosyltransferase family A protein [Oceanobacillus manasiensis]